MSREIAIPATRLCATHHGPSAPLAEPGSHVCTHCHTRLARTLADLPRLHTQLIELELTSRDGSSGRAGRNSTPPLRLDVLALLDPRSGPDPDTPPIAGIIRDWATLVADERQLQPAATTASQLDLLARHHDWLAAQPHLIGDFTREIRAVHAALRRVCGEATTVIATCQAPSDDGDECGGPLVHSPNSLHPVVCLHCGDRWSAQAIAIAVERMNLTTWRADTA